MDRNLASGSTHQEDIDQLSLPLESEEKQQPCPKGFLIIFSLIIISFCSSLGPPRLANEASCGVPGTTYYLITVDTWCQTPHSASPPVALRPSSRQTLSPAIFGLETCDRVCPRTLPPKDSNPESMTTPSNHFANCLRS